MDESHTGENIYAKIRSVLLDWNIYDKTSLCLRDNAANMVAAFKEGMLNDAGCVNHTLQVI